MRYKLLGFIALSFLLVSAVKAVPTSSFQRTLLPQITNTYDLGSVNKQWLNLFSSTLTVSNPASSTVVATSSGFAQSQDLHVQGNYLYITSLATNYFSVLDIKQPTNPILISTTTLASPTRFIVHGKYAYIVEQTGGGRIRMLDISDPKSPLSMGVIGAGSFFSIHDVAYYEGYLYVTDNTSGAVTAWDVHNVSAPPITPVFTFNIPNAHGLAIYSHYLLIGNNDDNIIYKYNIANPTTPTYVTEINTAARINEILVSGNYAYIVGEDYNAISIVDVSSNAAMVQVGDFAPLYNPTSVYVAGGYAYVMGLYAETMGIFDVSNPYSVTQVKIPNSGAAYLTYNWGGLEVNGKYAYTTSYTTGTLFVYDIKGAKISSADIGGLKVEDVNVVNTLKAQDLSVAGQMWAGQGLNSQNTSNFWSNSGGASAVFYGNVGINSSSPSKQLVITTNDDVTDAVVHITPQVGGGYGSSLELNGDEAGGGGAGILNLMSDEISRGIIYGNSGGLVVAAGASGAGNVPLFLIGSQVNAIAGNLVVGLTSASLAVTTTVNAPIQLNGLVYDTSGSAPTGYILSNTERGTKMIPQQIGTQSNYYLWNPSSTALTKQMNLAMTSTVLFKDSGVISAATTSLMTWLTPTTTFVDNAIPPGTYFLNINALVLSGTLGGDNYRLYGIVRETTATGTPIGVIATFASSTPLARDTEQAFQLFAYTTSTYLLASTTSRISVEVIANKLGGLSGVWELRYGGTTTAMFSMPSYVTNPVINSITTQDGAFIGGALTVIGTSTLATTTAARFSVGTSTMTEALNVAPNGSGGIAIKGAATDEYIKFVDNTQIYSIGKLNSDNSWNIFFDTPSGGGGLRSGTGAFKLTATNGGNINIPTSTMTTSTIIYLNSTNVTTTRIALTGTLSCNLSTSVLQTDSAGKITCGTLVGGGGGGGVSTSTANYFTFYQSATSVTGTPLVQFSNGAIAFSTNTAFTSSTFSGLVTIGTGGLDLPNSILDIYGSSSLYVQMNLENTNPTGSGDIVVTADDGTDTTFYVDMGINNSLFNDPNYSSMPPHGGYFYAAGGSLTLGTSSSTAPIYFIAGGTTSSSIRLVIDGNDMNGGGYTALVSNPVNQTTTIKKVLNDPETLPTITAASTVAIYSDDPNRWLQMSVAIGGTMYLTSNGFAAAASEYLPGTNIAQSITAATLFGTNWQFRGGLTSNGLHIVQGSSTTLQQWAVKITTSSIKNSIATAANWRTASFSGPAPTSTSWMAGYGCNNLYWFGTSTSALAGYSLNTSTKTFTFSQQINILNKNMGVTSTRAFSTGFAVTSSTAPFLNMYDCNGNLDTSYPAKLVAAPANGPDIVATPWTIYGLNGRSTTNLTKLWTRK